jgi:XTP/dITP diphosphohydrolase
MKYILASTNAHKAQELNELLSKSGMEIKAAKEKFEVIEDGETFQENALIKAKAYFDKYGEPTIADDSGLVVPSMPEILGIYSARFAPEHSDYKDKNLKLIEMLKDSSDEDKKAYFVCYLCFYNGPNEVFFFEGRVHGVIGDEIKGDDGFGYDPIFLPDGQMGKSMAEVSQWKMNNSHRAKACAEAAIFFKQ